MNPLASASMATAVDVAREASAEAPMILWPAGWPAPELVAWTLAHMLAETLPVTACLSPPRDDVQPKRRARVPTLAAS